MDVRVIDFDIIGCGTLTRYPDGKVGISYNREMLCRRTRNSYAVIGADTYPSRFIESSCYCRIRRNPADIKLYVESKSRISRDLLRQSGYQIVRDPEKADYIVVPSYTDDNVIGQATYYKYNIAAVIDDKELGLFSINMPYTERNLKLDENHITAYKDRIQQYFSDKKVDFYYDDRLIEKKCFFCPGVPVYKDIIEQTYDRCYVFDSHIAVAAQVDINLETLEIWSHCKDEYILEKQIINSNWKDYPFTVAKFIMAYGGSLVYSSNANMKMILDNLGFDSNMRRWGADFRFPVKPDDWNLMQKWTMKKLNLPEEGGFARKEDMGNLNYQLRELVRQRVAVKPFYTNTPMTQENIEQLMKNS